jgi:outer membrane protein assembly factor BamB
MKLSCTALRTALILAALFCLAALSGFSAPATPAPFDGEEETAGETSNWPRWRGPNGSGISPETNLPTEWGETKNVLWKVSLPGKGHSSPIVWGNRVFLTTAIEGEEAENYQKVIHFIGGKEWRHPMATGDGNINTLKVYALDRDTGKVVWERTAYTGTVYDSRHSGNSRASETPVTDGKLVIAYFGSGGLYAYDFAGKLLWQKHLADIGTYSVGTGSSPLLYKNFVIIKVDNEDGKDSFITALDKKTGKEIWKTARDTEITWSTPVLADSSIGKQLVTVGAEWTIAYDPATGMEIWRIEGLKNTQVPSPVAGNGYVVVSVGYPDKRVQALRLGESLKQDERVIWNHNKGTGYIPSPLLYNNYLYLISDGGIMSCLDAKTGTVVYRGGRVPVPGKFSASILAYGDKLMLFNQDGDSFVIQAGPEHKVLHTNSLPEPIWATPAISDGKLFIRGEKTLYAIANSASE